MEQTLMRLTGLTTLLTLVPVLAFAQEPAQPGPETLLHLSATGSVQALPDQLVADLLSQSTSASPADAQRKVNVQISRGMQEAKAISGVEAQALGYEVSPADDKRSKWTAQQTLELLGSEGPTLLDLTNRLQAEGFVTSSLEWRLSPTAQRKAMADATTEALKALQTQATSAAAALGLRVVYIKEVQLQDYQPARPMGVMMAARAMPSPPPQATNAAQVVTAVASAVVVLH
jgi:uncharacterized protein YggE